MIDSHTFDRIKNNVVIGIYKITSPCGKSYVGQSKNIYKRYLTYQKKDCKGQVKLYRSLVKYGFHNHKFEVVLECEINELNKYETEYIKKYGCITRAIGLNCDMGGNARNIVSSETKRKMSIAKKTESARIISIQNLKKAHEKGSPNKGKKMSKETIDKMLATKAKRRHLYKIRDYTCSEETKEKIRETLTGKKISQETIVKRSLTVSKILLNMSTGIYYYGYKEASDSLNMNKCTFINRLKRNTTLKITDIILT